MGEGAGKKDPGGAFEKTVPVAGDGITRVYRPGDALPQPAPESERTEVHLDSPAHRPSDDDKTQQATMPLPGAAAPTRASSAPAVPAIAVPTVALPDGYRLHEYRVDAILGQGGFGITYLATDINLNAKVAIKEYLPEQFATRAANDTVSPRTSDYQGFYETGLEAYLVEARTLATFRHPNIVRVARFFEANNTAYMVLEYERGKSLKTWWRTKADMSERDLLKKLAPLLDGLAVVHDAGFLHRDIKPDNIIVRDEDESFVLLDFGAARENRAGARDEASVVTPGYGPIEQYMNGDQGPWTDIYALGATLYWMISGRKPLEAPERMVDKDPLAPASSIAKARYSPEFLKAIDWALEPEAKDRPRDVAELSAALFAAHGSEFDLRNALNAGGEEAAVPSDSWPAALSSPRLFLARVKRFGRSFAHPGSWPMAVKMTLAMVAAALAPMLIAATYNYKETVARVTDSELRNLEQLAASLAGRISQLIKDSRNLAEYLGTDEDFVALLLNPKPDAKASIKLKLEGLVKSNPDVQLVMVFDNDGTVVASSDPAVTGKNFKFREYFRAAREGKAYISGITVGAVAGEPGIFYANPVFEQGGGVIGAVVLRIKGAAISSMLENARQGQDRIPFLVDGDGILIHYSDPKQLYKSLVPLPKDKLEAIVADQRFRRNAIESLDMPELAKAMVGNREGGNLSYTSKISGQEEIAGFAPVLGHNWVVGVSEKREYFESPLNRLFRNVLLSVVVIGLFFVILAILFARTIVRPIEQLTAAAHALKSGDYDRAAVQVKTRDEIGQLARVFNVMIDVLRQREREHAGRPRRGRAPRDSSHKP